MRLHGLHGALTWRYMLVTIGAILLIAVVGVVAAARFLPPYTSGMQPSVYMMAEWATTAAGYLEVEDEMGLAQWLQALDQSVINLTLRDDWLRINLARFPDHGTQTLLVFDPAKGVIAASSPAGPFRDISAIAELPGPFDDSLFTSLPPRPGANQVMTQNGNQSVTMMPIQRQDGTLLGLLILVNLATDAPPTWGAVLRTVGMSLLLLTIAVAGLGALFGAFAARFLVRRVDQLVTTTARWGEGDFSQPVSTQQSAHDELDALANHLNALRPQIEESLALGKQLAVQGERNRIARELHDSVKQQLFTLRMHLATAEAVSAAESPALPHLALSIALAEDAQEEVTALIDVFHRATQQAAQTDTKLVAESDTKFDEATLVSRLRILIDKWQRQTAIPVTSLLPASVAASAQTTHALLRIVQEALANSHKHSNCTQVTVTLEQVDESNVDYIKLSISDDGVGFDPAAVQQKSTGLGLSSMRERAAALGGEVTFQSTALGTTVVVTIPGRVIRDQ